MRKLFNIVFANIGLASIILLLIIEGFKAGV